MDRTPAALVNAIRICLILAPVLASVMSLTSDYNRHPDEIHHFEATRYYVDHFLPPEIGDPSVRGSYSVWGVSYLNYHWIEYLLAGKFVLIATPIVGEQLIAARLFNVALFAVLIAFFRVRSRDDPDILIIPAFLLVTPQVWYVFSYVNNDAFPLAMSFIAAHQIAHPRSMLNLWLGGERGSIAPVMTGLLFGLILISKSNYYAFLIFAAMWMLGRLASEGALKFDTELIRKYAIVAVVAILVLGFRCSLDFYVNGETNFVGVSYLNYFAGNFEKQESRLMKYQEEIADPPFKPSAIERDLGSTFPELRLKDKGVPYRDIFTKWRWHEISFRSFVGVYGYMTIFAGDWYYRIMMLVYAAFGVWAIVTAVRRKALLPMIVLAFGTLTTIFVSSYLSWSYAFQAQGRYLFPILPMTAVFIFAIRDSINRLALTCFIVACFLLSAYSFIFVGVAGIDSAPVSETAIDTTGFPADAMIRGKDR